MASVLGAGTGQVGESDGPVTVALAAEPTVPLGGIVRAEVYTFAERDVLLQGGAVSLGYTLAYRYNTGFFGATYTGTARGAATVAELALPGPTLLREGNVLHQEVLLEVPADGPPTADTPLVSVEWSTQAAVRYDGTQEARAEPAPVAVLADGRGADPPSPLVVAGGRHRDDIELVVLSGRRLGPGGRVSGEVVVVPRRPGPLAAVRVELVLVTLVPHGPWLVDDPARNPEPLPKESETVVDAEEVIGVGRAQPGVALHLPFALEAPPALPAPSWVTDEFSLRWLLRAVVDRRHRRRTTVELELRGSTLA